MTIQEANQQLLFQLFHIYDEREARSITDLVMEFVTEWKKIDRVMNRQVPLSNTKAELLHDISRQLLEHKPVQYILKEAWFAGMKFHVNEHVLIPRPETEELANWVIRDMAGEQNKVILDVGTGSGCIAVTIKKKLPQLFVTACDISEQALQVARLNAAACMADIEWITCDFLNAGERDHLRSPDVIVSNPPYIPVKEKSSMAKHVIDYEPHQALFVNDEDPLLFYETISLFAKKKLQERGRVYVEIHEDLEPAVTQLFQYHGFRKTDTLKDLQGKHRMIRAGDLIK